MIIRKIMFKKNKLLVMFSVLLSVVGGFIVLQTNENIKAIFNDNILGHNTDNFIIIFIFTMTLYIISFGLNLLREYLMQKFTWNGSQNIVKYFTAKVINTDYEYFTKNEPASIWTNLQMSSQQAATFYSRVIDCIAVIISFLFYAFIVFSINIYAGLFSILAIPVYMVLTKNTGSKSMSLQTAMMDDSREMSVIAQEVFENTNNIKSKNNYSYFIQKISDKWKKTFDHVLKLNILLTYFRGITGMLNIIIPIFILFAMVNLTSNFNLDTGSIIVLYINIPSFLSGFNNFYTILTQNNTNKPGIQKLMAIEDLPKEASGSKELSTFETLETHNLKVSFNKSHLIAIPDIRILKGEKIMIFGESGVGKSTLFNILMGLRSKYEGSVLINGIEAREIEIKSLRKLFGITFQGGNIFSLTLKENIKLELELGDKNVDELIDITNLSSQYKMKSEDILNDKIISGGEKSRINLAQTLAREPEVLLLDETFSNIDEEMEGQIITKIFEKYSEKTILCISHRLSSSKYFDRTILSDLETV